MAYIFDVNQPVVANGAAALFRLKEVLKAAGWVVPRSSDGSQVGNVDAISYGGAGVEGMDNNRAWFVIRQPGSPAREFCFQIVTAGAQGYMWRVKYSGAGGFTGGTATQVGSAPDEVVLVGGGTDAAPTTGVGTWSGSNFRFNCAAGGADEGYTFYHFALNAGDLSKVRHGAYFEVMAAGTEHPNDVDPAVIYFPIQESSGFFTFSDQTSSTSGQAPRGWIGKTFPGAGFVSISPCYIRGTGSVDVLPGGIGSDIYTAKDVVAPVIFGRGNNGNAAPYGIKGVGRMVRCCGTARVAFDTLSLAGTKDYVYLGGSSPNATMLVPWNGSDVLA